MSFAVTSFALISGLISLEFYLRSSAFIGGSIMNASTRRGVDQPGGDGVEERRCFTDRRQQGDFQPAVPAAYLLQQTRQVLLEVAAHGEKQRGHRDPLVTRRDQPVHAISQSGAHGLEKRQLHGQVGAGCSYPV